MPKGRSKGFGHYMCKKFFHPGNPENLERVFVAKEKLKEKDKKEREKMAEYEREQEHWNNRSALTATKDKDKLALSFMYEPPGGVKNVKEPENAEKSELKFDWQRGAPRESYAKEDPNIIDHPFGINVQFTKCIRCQVWGHAHTDKHCPKYGTAKIDDEPTPVMNEKKLIQEMKQQDKLQFTSYGTWDNGKTGKHYDLVYSSLSEDEGAHSDLMAGLLKEIRGKEKKIKVLRKEVEKQERKSGSRKRRKKQSKRSASTSSKQLQPKSRRHHDHSRECSSVRDRNSPVEVRRTATKEHMLSEQSRKDYLNKIDDILFSDIGPPPSTQQRRPNISTAVVTLPDNNPTNNSNITNQQTVMDKNSTSVFKNSINTKKSATKTPNSPSLHTKKTLTNESSAHKKSSHCESPIHNRKGKTRSLTPLLEGRRGNLNRSDDSFLSEVDQILGLVPDSGKPGNVVEKSTNRSGSHGCDSTDLDSDEDSSNDGDSDDDDDESDTDDGSSTSGDESSDSDKDDAKVSEENSDKVKGVEGGTLTAGELRLLDLIQRNKIDVKSNYKDKYGGDSCHFCRILEDTAHLAVCPVYNDIMKGSEFQDIHSQDVRRRKKALKNIHMALLKRSKALSLTSMAPVTSANMRLLDPSLERDKVPDDKTRRALEILESS